MSQLKQTFQTKDGFLLKTYQWLVDNPKGVICLVHGLGEHAGRYQHVANFLNDHGYSLLSYDVRGHGLSEGQRGHTPNFDYLHDDIQLFIDVNADKIAGGNGEKNIPIYIYGHSLGGLQVITYLLRRKPNNIAGAIVTSPALRPAFSPPAWKLLLAKASVKLLPSLSVSNEIDVSHISRDRQVIDTYLNDELVHDRISAGLGLNILNQGEWALENASNLQYPMLLMHGSKDEITSSDASQKFADSAGDTCHFKLWNGLFHETHNEPEKDEVLSTMIQWLELQ